MLMYDENSQIMFAILLTLVSCHINTDIQCWTLMLYLVWLMCDFTDSFTWHLNYAKGKLKRLHGRKVPHFFIHFEEEKEIKYTIILKVFISYAKRMYNLWIYVNERLARRQTISSFTDRVNVFLSSIRRIYFSHWRKNHYRLANLWFGCIRMQMSLFQAMAPRIIIYVETLSHSR